MDQICHLKSDRAVTQFLQVWRRSSTAKIFKIMPSERSCFDQEILLLISDIEEKQQCSSSLEVWDNSVIESQIHWAYDFKN